MTIITTHLEVEPDGVISSDKSLPAGESVAHIEIADAQPGLHQPGLDVSRLPLRDMGEWPAALSLRREDIYRDDGR